MTLYHWLCDSGAGVVGWNCNRSGSGVVIVVLDM